MLTCGDVYHPLGIISIVEYQKEPKILGQPNWPINSPRCEAITLSDLILPYQDGLRMERFKFGDIGLLCGVKGLIAMVSSQRIKVSCQWGRLALQMRTVGN